MIKFLQMRFFSNKTTNNILCKTKKKPRADPKSYDYVPLLGKNDKNAVNKIFLQKKQ